MFKLEIFELVNLILIFQDNSLINLTQLDKVEETSRQHSEPAKRREPQRMMLIQCVVGRLLWPREEVFFNEFKIKQSNVRKAPPPLPPLVLEFRLLKLSPCCFCISSLDIRQELNS